MHSSAALRQNPEFSTSSDAQGYPGTVKATVTYILTDGVAKQDKGYLRAIMTATTDKVLSPRLARLAARDTPKHC